MRTRPARREARSAPARRPGRSSRRRRFRCTCRCRARRWSSTPMASARRVAERMPGDDRVVVRTASVEERVDAIQAALEARGLKAAEAVEEIGHKAQEEWLPRNGARVVAHAWIDPGFRKRLLANGLTAVTALGVPMPQHHPPLRVLENTPQLQNMICCTLCSRTPFPP